MPIIHTYRYLKKTTEGIKQIEETGPLTRAKAIKANCLDCVGGSTIDVKRCTTAYCPFWIFRPYQDRDKNTEENEDDSEEI